MTSVLLGAMFGYLAAGRLPSTECSQVSETLFLMQVEYATAVNHLCVFMTGSTPFPEGYGGSIHIGWPPPSPTQSDPVWQYLGFISNEKPSAIFRIARGEPGAAPTRPFGPSGSSLPQNIPNTTVLVGVSVELLPAIAEKLPDASSQVVTVDFQTQFVTKMLDSFINYALSFEVAPSSISPVSADQFIPSRAVKSWAERFRTQMNLDPHFWTK